MDVASLLLEHRFFMKRRLKLSLPGFAAALCLTVFPPAARGAQFDARLADAGRIDRQALVTRHNVTLAKPEATTPLQVGNGEFAFSTDATGLQTFYGNTMSHWGWHTFPLPPGQVPADLRLQEFDTHGRKVGYATSAKGQEAIYNWLRENPHRINLGRLALLATNTAGRPISPADLQEPRQTLDLWRGIVSSRYSLRGQPVMVETCVHPERDLVAVHLESPLVAAGGLTAELSFPYGSPAKTGADWTKPGAHTTHRSIPVGEANRVDFARQLDADGYSVSLKWEGRATLREARPHTFVLAPAAGGNVIEFVIAFSKETNAARLPTFAEVKDASARHWAMFWNSGGAIDLSASKDPRWRELERRIVLSQYLMAIQAAGSRPPQESGLVNNGWNGKFHLEMHWWHGVHFALWNRWPLFERSLGWYRAILPAARQLAQSQGYRGARWPKMVGPEGRDSPSGVGPLLIWQQPHPIYYALLDYRLHPTPATLEKWRDVVFDTAEFLASFAVRDKDSGQYVLGPPIKTVPENTDPTTARNPTFELSYWRFGLREAQQWRERLALPREPAWDNVLTNLAPLPVQDGEYLQQEGMTDTYTKWNWEHPSLIGPRGMIPGDGVDAATMRATVRRVMATWAWERKNWGWDFPMMAMAAARNGEPALAIDALLHPAAKNQFAANGFSLGGPYPYFPSNGGLLAAVAMMAAGWDGAPAKHAPGFPDDGSWTVRWEGLNRAP